MPVVATYTGGVPSLIEDKHTGLFFPTGDASMLAAKLREIFENDNLAVHLGEQSCKVARQRHDPETVVNQILYSYQLALEMSSRSSCLKGSLE